MEKIFFSLNFVLCSNFNLACLLYFTLLLEYNTLMKMLVFVCHNSLHKNV